LASSLPPTIQRTNNYVGRSNWNGDDYLNGSLSDLRVYSGARTAQQISADRYSMLDSSDSTLSYAYSFNNTANSSLSGSTNAAPTLLGGAAIVPGPDLNVNVDNTYRPLQFSGASGQFLDLLNNAIGGDLSIETWVCLTSHANNATVIDIGTGVSSDNIILGFDGVSGRPVFKLFKNSVKILELVASTSALPLNQWTHLAATYDGAVKRFYVNGTLAGTGTLAVSLATNTPTLAAGTNLAADVGQQYRANATGAGTVTALTCPATPAAQQPQPLPLPLQPALQLAAARAAPGRAQPPSAAADALDPAAAAALPPPALPSPPSSSAAAAAAARLR
jgi:hypothetical protein